MSTVFDKLNEGWNAEPNAPEPQVSLLDGALLLAFSPNYFMYPEYENVPAIVLAFHGCTRYRLGPTNDEGWYPGQCRFSNIAPQWGEFYEVRGDLLIGELETEWTKMVGYQPTEQKKHFLFYFRDNTFECDADSWSKTNVT